MEKEKDWNSKRNNSFKIKVETSFIILSIYGFQKDLNNFKKSDW